MTVLAIFIIIITTSPCDSISTYDRDVTLTLPQKAMLDEFAALVKNDLPHKYMQEEMYLIRWLRVKDYNIPEAARFLLNNIKWRKENNMDTIFEEDFSDLEKEYKHYFESRDRAGQPMGYISVADLDIRKSVVNGFADRLLRGVDKALEESFQLVRTLGEKYKNITRAHLIVNLAGYNLVEHGCLRCIPVVLRAITSYEQHYPESLDHLLLFNVPSIAEPLLNLATGLLNPSTRRSLKVFGTNRRTNLQFLQEFLDPDEIPVGLGGTKRYRGMVDDYYDDDY